MVAAAQRASSGQMPTVYQPPADEWADGYTGIGFNMLMYHGSNMAVEKPRLIQQTRGLDFGAGFYLTTSESQAVRFSEIIVKRRKSGIATVSVYDFDMETAEESLSIRKFNAADIQWLRFVVGNRLMTYQGELYDIVISAVANDQVMPTIQALLGGFLTEEATILTLEASKLVDQICLKSEQALSLLSYIKAYEARGRTVNG